MKSIDISVSACSRLARTARLASLLASSVLLKEAVSLIARAAKASSKTRNASSDLEKPRKVLKSLEKSRTKASKGSKGLTCNVGLLLAVHDCLEARLTTEKP